MPFWKSGNIKKEKFFVSHTKSAAARIFGQCHQTDTFCLLVYWLGVDKQLDVPATGQLGAGFLGLPVSKVNGEMITKVQTTLACATLPAENSSEFIPLTQRPPNYIQNYSD
jgi:hypothetical protein